MKKSILIGIIVVIVVIGIGLYLSSNNAPLDDSGGMCLDERELFATEAEALAHSEKIGCTGSHMHSEYAKPYMACEDHQQMVDANAVC